MIFTDKNFLIPGGCGYIGSHTIVELLNLGAKVVVIDNLINSTDESLKSVAEITGKSSSIIFENIDLLDNVALHNVFLKYGPFDAVIHFAALKSVSESIKKPLMYYNNNIVGTLNLLECMKKFNCKSIIFSSSATVYGSAHVPITEESQIGVGITNPYGQTKFMMEQILRDVYFSDPTWSIVLLRYFNPVGAHSSGKIGESPDGIPNNLMPFVQQVAVGKRPFLNVFGNDYDTIDGTGVRDYIHVVDLAKGHCKALQWMSNNKQKCEVFNLGTGNGTSVLEMINTFEKVSGKSVPYKIVDRRSGDIATVYADTSKAENILDWKATMGIKEMCKDAWMWENR